MNRSAFIIAWRWNPIQENLWLSQLHWGVLCIGPMGALIHCLIISTSYAVSDDGPAEDHALPCGANELKSFKDCASSDRISEDQWDSTHSVLCGDHSVPFLSAQTWTVNDWTLPWRCHLDRKDPMGYDCWTLQYNAVPIQLKKWIKDVTELLKPK